MRLLERWAEGRGEEVREEEREYAASFCSWRKREDIAKDQSKMSRGFLLLLLCC